MASESLLSIGVCQLLIAQKSSGLNYRPWKCVRNFATGNAPLRKNVRLKETPEAQQYP
jgi:hypothetical protein